jgi:hypothetical protein
MAATLRKSMRAKIDLGTEAIAEEDLIFGVPRFTSR